VVITFAQFGNFGIGPAVTRYVAVSYEQADSRAVEEYTSAALFTLLVSGGCVFVVILLFRFQIISLFEIDGENHLLALWLLPYVGVLSLYLMVARIFMAILTGLGRMDLSNYIRTISRIIGIIAALLLLNSGKGVGSLLVGYFVTELIGHIACIISVKRIIPIRFLCFGKLKISTVKKLMSFGSGLLGANMISMLLTPFNKIMISRYIGLESVAVYEIVYNSAMSMRSIAASGIGALTPEMSRLSAKADLYKKRIDHIYRRTIWMMLMLGIPLFLVVFLLATPLLTFWLQDGFNPMLPNAFRIMLIGAFISLLGIPAYFTITGLGYSGKIFFCHAILAVLNVLIVISFIVLFEDLSVNIFFIAIALGTLGSTIYLLIQYKLLSRN